MSRRQAVELHCHLDGCVRPATIEALAAEQGIELAAPAATLATVRPDCRSLIDYFGAIDVALDVMQTPDALYRVAFELVEQWRDDRVMHGEARFAPELHTRRGLSFEEIVESVGAGLRDGRAQTGVSTALILCTMRPSPAAMSWRVVETAANSQHVVGVDLAGPELDVPLLPHAPSMRAAKDAGLRVTIHAGEADTHEEVWQAIDELGAERIGHGVKSADDPALVARLASDGITLEMCPTSNLQTTAVATLAEHPIERFRTSGVPISLSTDCRTTSGVTIESEYHQLREAFGWDEVVWNTVQRSALRAAFVPTERRGTLEARFEHSIR